MLNSDSDDVETVSIVFTAFREDQSAELVMVSYLTFNDCQVSSEATFVVGERLRLHQRGQGWIEAEVEWTADDRAGMVFLTVPRF